MLTFFRIIPYDARAELMALRAEKGPADYLDAVWAMRYPHTTRRSSMLGWPYKPNEKEPIIIVPSGKAHLRMV